MVSRTDIPEAIDVAKHVIKTLDAAGIEVHVESETSISLRAKSRAVDLTDMDVDFVSVVGGDGSILRTAMLMREPSTPILGVNLGRRGFLTEVSPNEVSQAIDRVQRGDYRLEECVKLSSMVVDGKETFPDSLNEILVASSLPSKVIDLSLSVDGEHIINVQADGVIVATTTGSTAYSLSAGGSILAPEVPAMIMTAVSPDSYFRSIVAPLTSRVRIELLKPRADALGIIDGRLHKALKPGSAVEVWASEHRARFIRFRSFYERLHRRLQFRRIL